MTQPKNNSAVSCAGAKVKYGKQDIAHCGSRTSSVKVWRCTVVFYALLLPSMASFAGPDGGQVMGGNGSITASGNTTTINQASQNMAIDWQSYNVNANERVQYIQPNSSSTSLNRILSQNGSTIAGRIDANGQVILVNPNGIFFTPTSIINVGGIIASGLNIQPNDFMNGNYIFDEVLGTDGTVINSGIINASLGGNVALIGKQVKNDGLIVANLGSVNLAAGKQAVLTFDDDGLLGVRVSKEILQEELGVDPAVLNSGEINAEGGRVLLTASTSQDVFSQAVNTGSLNQPLSVVMHEDGSFTLGNGANVLNTGSIDTSTTANDQNAGRIVLLGENVTSSGELHADAAMGNGGDIELHAQDTTLLTGNSVTSAQSETNGQGGGIKVLGDRVGLFDQSTVDVSGANGGGQALIGGGFQGANTNIRNARFTQIGRDTRLFADALVTGDGGTIINWGNEYTWFYGIASARGGQQQGDGGLVEISGKGLAFNGTVDTRAVNGMAGSLLFDPLDIIIHNGAGPQSDDGELPSIAGTDGNANSVFNISESALEAISATTNISLKANRNITIDDLADGVLDLQTGSSNQVTFEADADGNGSGSFVMNDITNTIRTEGGDVNIFGASVTAGNIDTTGASGSNGGTISIVATNGNIATGTLISSGGAATAGNSGNDAGSIRLFTGNTAGTNDTITLNGNIIANGSDADAANVGGNAGSITLQGEDRITLNGDITNSAQGGNSTDINNVGLHNTINIDTPLLETTGVVTLTTKRSRNYNTSAQGDIILGNDGSIAQTILRGNLMAIAGYNSDTNLITTIDYNGITTGTLTLNAGKDVNVVGVINDSDTTNADELNVSLNANTDGGNNGDVIINDIQDTSVTINTGGGTYTVTGVNYDGESTASSKITVDTGTGNAEINVTGYVRLGEMIVDGNLDVTAGGIDAGNSIRQGTLNTLTVTGAASFVSNASTGNIDLTNNNDLQGAISITTTGSNADATLNNTATTTTLDTVNVGGSLTINADQNLTLINSSGSNSITVTDTAELNFGLDDSASTFTAQTGVVYSASTSTITGGTGNNIFELSASLSGIINGADGNDTFNINASGLTFSDIRGGSNIDTVRGPDVTNTWVVNADDGGTLNSTIIFSGMETLTGGAAVDTFTITTAYNGDINGGDNNDVFNIGADVSGTITGGAGNDRFEVTAATSGQLQGGADNDTFNLGANSTGSVDGNAGNDNFTILADGLTATLVGGTSGTDTVTANNSINPNAWNINTADGGILNSTITFSQMETLTGGTGTDNFLVNNSGTISQINGGSGTNTLTARNTINEWDINASNAGALYTDNNADGFGSTYVNGFSNIQNLTGGTATDRFVMGANGSIGTIDGGSATSNTLAARQGVGNIWDFATDESGTLTQSGETTPYVNFFTNIQTRAVGGTGNEWADLSNANTNTFNVENYFDFTGIIGNGTTSILNGQNGQSNNWTVQMVTGPDGNSTDGINDGLFSNNNGSLTFIDFNNLTGDNGNDIFTIGANGNLSGLLSGGGGTGNTLTILNTSIASVEIETDTVGSPSNLNVTGINGITGNGVTVLISDSLVAGDWTITGTNAGTLNVMTFNNFATLQGGTNADTFRLHASIDFAGSIDGGNGGGIDEIIAGNRETNDWVITASNNTGTVTGITGNFSGIETLTGGNQTDNFTLLNAVNFNGSMNGGDGTDQLTGGNRSNTWTINGNNAGSVTGLGNGFTAMETLVGGSQQDTFNLSDVMTFNGTLSGGTQNNDQNDRLVAGNRENDWAVTGANNTGTVTGLAGAFTAIEFLNGNNQRDTLTLSNTGTFSGSFDGGGGINDAVIGGNTTNNWTITAADNTGTVTGLSGTFSRVEALTGTSAQDTFTLLAGIDFNGSINGGGGSITDTLIGGATDNTWVIDGTNGNTVTGLGAGNTFSNIQNLSGATGAFDDTFIFRNAGSIAGSINGGGQAIRDIVDMSALNSAITVRLGVGQDVTNVERVIGNNNGTSNEPDPFDSTLVAENNRNTWGIDGINRGTVDDVEFIDFNNLQGGTAADTFVISDGGDITGLIDGGSPNRAPWTPGTATPAPVVEGILQTEDILDYSALASVDIIIDTDFSNIELVKGNTNGSGTGDSTLGTGATGDNNWLILSAGTGVVNSMQFVDFNNIVGGNGDDTFVVNGDFGGSIRGGGGGGTDTVNYQALDTSRVVFGGERGITEIERVEGNGSGFTIVGRAGFDNTWTINGSNQGDVTAGSETLAFIGFDNIEGNNESAYTDTFTVQGGNIDGSVLGMAGDDTLIVELTGSETGQLFFNGGAGTNTVLLQDGATTAAYRGEYTTGIAGGYDQLQYTNIIAGTPRIFTLNYQQAGQVQDTVSADSLIVNGTPDADMIELGFDSAAGMNTFGVSSATSIVHYSNKDDLTVLGLGDVNDTVNITSASSLVGETGVLTINAETVTSTSTITANQLVLDSVITAGTVSAPMNINVTNLSLTDSANVASQALYLQAQNGLTLTQLAAVERVDITVLDGNFMSSAALTTNSQLDISTLGTTGGNIVLIGDNQLSGAVTLNAANDIIFDGDNTFLGTTSFKADNNILSTGANTVSASISLDATRIDLSGDNRITAAIVLNGTTATINNTVATDLGDVTVQNLTVASTGNITDSDIIDVQADGDGMGKATFTATNGNIVLDNVANNFDVINLTATNGAVTVNEADGISIATANMNGALNVTSNIGLAANEVSTDNNMALGNITAATIDLNANKGAIVSQSSNNLTANMITLVAASGIGTGGGSGAINTNTSTLSVINASFEEADEPLGADNVNVMATSGVININNIGNVTINDLRNNGDITLMNAGNITLNVTDSSGAIDAHYGGNISDSRYAGNVTLNAGGNNFSTLGIGTLSGNADIIAETLDVSNVSRFGTPASPIGLRVNTQFTLLFANQGTVYYLGSKPNVTTTADLRELAIRGFIGISSQQLIDVDSLSEIDPAIFTEVRNYNYDDIAIRLPADQDYGDDEDEKENGEEKEG